MRRRVVAMIEIVSPGNKAARHSLRSFVEKAAESAGPTRPLAHC